MLSCWLKFCLNLLALAAMCADFLLAFGIHIASCSLVAMIMSNHTTTINPTYRPIWKGPSNIKLNWCSLKSGNGKETSTASTTFHWSALQDTEHDFEQLTPT